MSIDHDEIRRRIRDRIEAVDDLTMRSVSLAAFGSDSALHKFLSGANKSIKVDNLSSVADAMGVPLTALLCDPVGPGEGRTVISEDALREMVDTALSEMQPGMSIAEIRPLVASNLHGQLERVLSGQVVSNPEDTESVLGKAALSDAPTKAGGQAI